MDKYLKTNFEIFLKILNKVTKTIIYYFNFNLRLKYNLLILKHLFNLKKNKLCCVTILYFILLMIKPNILFRLFEM